MTEDKYSVSLVDTTEGHYFRVDVVPNNDASDPAQAARQWHFIDEALREKKNK
jgi:hypothetical protein